MSKLVAHIENIDIKCWLHMSWLASVGLSGLLGAVIYKVCQQPEGRNCGISPSHTVGEAVCHWRSFPVLRAHVAISETKSSEWVLTSWELPLIILGKEGCFRNRETCFVTQHLAQHPQYVRYIYNRSAAILGKLLHVYCSWQLQNIIRKIGFTRKKRKRSRV